jgi:hypothetical protein
MLNRLSFIFCLLFLVFGLSNTIFAQTTDSIVKEKELSAIKIENERIKAHDLQDLLGKISYYYEIPIGLEIELNETPSPVYIDFKEGTLSQLLDEIVKHYDDYSWEIKDGAVNVFPKSKYRDDFLKELLDTKIGSFKISEKTTCVGLGRDLVKTAEIDKVLKANNMRFIEQNMSGFYIMTLGEKFTLEASDMTLKEILNKVVKESPTAEHWEIRREDWDRQVFRIFVSASSEETPKELRQIRWSIGDFDF